MPNGILSTKQLRYAADAVSKYDPQVGVLDVTTRMNLQLRGVTLEDSSDLVNGFYDIGLCSIMRCVCFFVFFSSKFCGFTWLTNFYCPCFVLEFVSFEIGFIVYCCEPMCPSVCACVRVWRLRCRKVVAECITYHNVFVFHRFPPFWCVVVQVTVRMVYISQVGDVKHCNSIPGAINQRLFRVLYIHAIFKSPGVGGEERQV